MTPRTLPILPGLLIAIAALSGCVDAASQPKKILSLQARLDAVKFWDVTASTRWNQRALVLVGQRPPANPQAADSRMLTYLSLAQYRAVLAAEDAKNGSTHPSASAAVGAASAAVLGSFFPLDVAVIEARLDADLAAPGWPGAEQQDPASGEAIGRAVASTVLALAAGALER